MKHDKAPNHQLLANGTHPVIGNVRLIVDFLRHFNITAHSENIVLSSNEIGVEFYLRILRKIVTPQQVPPWRELSQAC